MIELIFSDKYNRKATITGKLQSYRYEIIYN